MFVLAMLCWPDNDFLLDYLIVRLFLKNYARKWTAKVGCFEKLSRRRSSGYSQALAARESNRSHFVSSLRYASQCLFSLFWRRPMASLACSKDSTFASRLRSHLSGEGQAWSCRRMSKFSRECYGSLSLQTEMYLHTSRRAPSRKERSVQDLYAVPACTNIEVRFAKGLWTCGAYRVTVCDVVSKA